MLDGCHYQEHVSLSDRQEVLVGDLLLAVNRAQQVYRNSEPM